MKLCVFSDIHGNSSAFEAALPIILAEKADYNIFLGDICGYYFDTLRAWKLLQTIPNLIALAGNHDALFLSYAEQRSVPDAYTEQYGPSMNVLLTQPAEELSGFTQWMRGLSHSYHHADGSFSCFHGGPNQPATEYVYPDSPLPEVSSPVVFMGHTHCPMFRKTEATFFCNPGSVGQPRHGSFPSFAVVDTAREDFQFRIHRIPFDKDGFIGSLAPFAPYPKYLTDILRKIP